MLSSATICRTNEYRDIVNKWLEPALPVVSGVALALQTSHRRVGHERHDIDPISGKHGDVWMVDEEPSGGLCGVGLVSYGAWLIYPPAGFITGGLLLIVGALMVALGNRAAG